MQRADANELIIYDASVAVGNAHMLWDVTSMDHIFTDAISAIAIVRC